MIEILGIILIEVIGKLQQLEQMNQIQLMK
jgi:hypothetical protein